MPFDTWLAFFVAAWLISLSPGAGALSCVSAGTRHGYARAFWNTLGLQLGILLTIAVAAAGYTGFAARVLRLLRALRHRRAMNRASGGLFVAAGLFLATFRRAA